MNQVTSPMRDLEQFVMSDQLSSTIRNLNHPAIILARKEGATIATDRPYNIYQVFQRTDGTFGVSEYAGVNIFAFLDYAEGHGLPKGQSAFGIEWEYFGFNFAERVWDLKRVVEPTRFNEWYASDVIAIIRW